MENAATKRKEINYYTHTLSPKKPVKPKTKKKYVVVIPVGLELHTLPFFSSFFTNTSWEKYFLGSQ